jgi:DNA modification methylase
MNEINPKAHADGIAVYCAHDGIVPFAELRPNPLNPNTHSDRQIEMLAEIIRRQGWRNPITVSTRSGYIVRGHGRLMAARLLRVSAVPVDYQDYASESEEWADLIADNRLAELAEMDAAKLVELLGQIDASAIELSGYTQDELTALAASLSEQNALAELADSVAPDAPETPFTQSGDKYIFAGGTHVLICGDSTKPDTLAALMGDDKADLVITDPPYNVDYAGHKKIRDKILNDRKSGDTFYRFLIQAFAAIKTVCRAGTAVYVFHADIEGVNFRIAFTEAGFSLRQVLIWVKNHFVISRQDYHWIHEPILYGWLDGSKHYFIDDRSQTTKFAEESPDFRQMKKAELLNYILSHEPAPETLMSVIYCDKPQRSDAHPTMKPVKLVARLIKNSSRAGEIVLDPFGGSGTTLIAAEQLGRRARLVELDPRYCDVTVRRYAELTGKRDVLLIRHGAELRSSDIKPLTDAANESNGG